jgi:hypothetical protein
MANSLESIRREVIDSQGVLTVDMAKLRDAYGAGRLGRYVLDGIKEELRKEGVHFISDSLDGHPGEQLPNNQYDVVRLYILDSLIGKIITAAYTVDREGEGDRILRAVNESDATKQIQELKSENEALRERMEDIRDILRD